MKILKQLTVIAILATFTIGCAPTQKHNFRMLNEFWTDSSNNIVIAKTNPPAIKARTALGKYLTQTDLSWYQDALPQKFVTQLKKRKISSEIYSDSINSEQSSKATSIVTVDSDKLMLLELQGFGITHNNDDLVATTKAYCVIKGELVDRQSKKVLWRHLADIEEPVKGAWDQPPVYPNFTAALQEAFSSAQEELIDSFFSGH